MVLASFQVEDKLGLTWYFREIVLLSDISVELVLSIVFLIFSNADI